MFNLRKICIFIYEFIEERRVEMFEFFQSPHFNYRCIDEFEILKRPASPLSCTKAEKSDPKEDVGRLNLDQFKSHLREEGFEPVVDSERLHIWRKREPNRQNYTYKGTLTFTNTSY